LFGCSSQFSDVIFTAGGRAGWSMGNWLPYVAGGYAATRFYADAKNVSLAPVGATIVWWDDRTDGWYMGGGFDWAFAQGVSLGIEYRHYDFKKATTARAVIGGLPGPLPNDSANFKTTADSVAARLTYRFSAAPI
jgi:opacity protein-like surface antigen